MSDPTTPSGREIALQFPVLPPRIADRLLDLLLPSEPSGHRDAIVTEHRDAGAGPLPRQTAETPSEPMAS